MKKIIAMLLLLSMLLALVGCGEMALPLPNDEDQAASGDEGSAVKPGETHILQRPTILGTSEPTDEEDAEDEEEVVRPTRRPTAKPSGSSSVLPTLIPTEAPTAEPTIAPSDTSEYPEYGPTASLTEEEEPMPEEEGEYIYDETSCIGYLIYDDHCVVHIYYGYENYITFPESYAGLPVTGISSFAIMWTENLYGISIPASITEIEEGAFACCTALSQITIDADNPRYTVFEGCLIDSATKTLIAARQGATIPAPSLVTRIGDYAFALYLCTSFALPEGITEIGEGVFYGCDSMYDLSLPSTLGKIGESAFYYCTSLSSITIPASVYEIGAGAFGGMNLQSLTVAEENPVYYSYYNGIIERATNTLVAGTSQIAFPIDGSVSVIGEGAFAELDLTSIRIPEGVTRIEVGAFYGCVALASITLPSTLLFIGESAFEYCEHLQTVYFSGTEEMWYAITIDDWNSCLRGAAIYCNGSDTPLPPPEEPTYPWWPEATEPAVDVPTIEVPFPPAMTEPSIPTDERPDSPYDGLIITKLGSVAVVSGWEGTSTHVSIPSTYEGATVMMIDDAVFYGKDILSIEIPETVTYIGNNAFYLCHELTYVYYFGSLSQWNEIYFCEGNERLLNATVLCAKADPIGPGELPTEEPTATPTFAPIDPSDPEWDDDDDDFDLDYYENPVLYHTPELDGVLDEEYLLSYQIETPYFSDMELSNRSKTYVLWDGEYIYFAVELYDDDMIQRSKAYTQWADEDGDINPYYNDCAEIWFCFELMEPISKTDVRKLGYDAFGVGDGPFSAVSEGIYSEHFRACDAAAKAELGVATDGFKDRAVIEFKIPAKMESGDVLIEEDVIYFATMIHDIAIASNDELIGGGFDPSTFVSVDEEGLRSGYTHTYTRAPLYFPADGELNGYSKATLTAFTYEEAYEYYFGY